MKTAEIYVDGSHNTENNTYGFGAIIHMDGKKYIVCDKSEKNVLRHGSTAGEYWGVIRGISAAQALNAERVIIYFDCASIEKVAKSNKKYKPQISYVYNRYMKEKEKELIIEFVKFKGHSGNLKHNEADTLARYMTGSKLSENKRKMCEDMIRGRIREE